MQTNEKRDLISVIKNITRESDGYKIANIVHLVLKILVWLSAIGTAIYSLILNGIVALLKGGGSLLSMEFFEMVMGTVAPLITIWTLSIIFVLTPMQFIKSLIIRKEVRLCGYDLGESLPVFRNLLAHAYDKTTAREATIAGMGWSILAKDNSKKSIITKIILGVFDFITYIFIVISLIILRICLDVFSMGGARSDTVLIAMFVFLAAMLAFFVIIGKLQVARQTKLLNSIEKNMKI